MSGRAAAAIVLAAVFFAGAATALGVLRLVEHRRETDGAFGPPPFPPLPPDLRPEAGERPRDFGSSRRLPEGARRYTDVARKRVTDRMARALQLTGEQREAIEEAMKRSHAAARETMAEALPRLESRLDSLNAEIDGILTEEQRAAFREFRRRDRDRFRREGTRWFRGRGRR
ncbi:MAG: hypothetical protein OXU64_06135 [Gemmatimonadota bacterium]|nr:hypothetical protein [Gemmatimonadota bacterium]